ncbi:MAG: septum formation initiator family protein [Nitrospinae bacterium]|nr:septum formation initiator family protein [Nitrospinota bacterium]
MIVKLAKTQRFLLMIFFLFMVMVLVAVFHKDGILTVFDFQKELVKLKDSNVSLAEENSRLRTEIGELKNDPFAMEKLAREKLNLVRPGETVYQIVREKGRILARP